MHVSLTSRHARRLLPGGSLALVAAAPVAIGGIIGLKLGIFTPLIMVPAITFGVVAVTSPALYIASAASGDGLTLGEVARSLRAALSAFGVALAGLVLPAAFLSLSSVERGTTVGIASAAIGGAAILAAARLAMELGSVRPMTGMRIVVFACWVIATLGIAARLWVSFSGQVLS